MSETLKLTISQTLVGIPQFAAHYCDVNFENPYEFIPERWTQILDDDSRSIFQPFAIGGRNCIGQNLAWAEMRLVLARVVYNFDLEPADDLCWLDQKSYYLWEKEPFLVRVSKRP
jgi:cytochrome P450